MQYRDLKKNTLNEFNANSRISCSLWQMPLSNEYFLHWHDYFTIDIIVEGTARNYNSYGYSNIEKGNMDLVLPSDIHHKGSLTGCKLYSIRFPFSAMPDTAKTLIDFPSRSVKLSEDELFCVSGIANTIIEFANDEEICKKSLECLLLILQSKDSFLKQKPTNNLRCVLDYLDINFSENPSLDDAAKIASYSSGYFSYIFRKTTGYTFSQYLTSKKLNYACAIMNDNSLTLSEIAARSGFTSFVAFNRAFNSVIGVSPKEYRKKYKK